MSYPVGLSNFLFDKSLPYMTFIFLWSPCYFIILVILFLIFLCFQTFLES